jgi:hypothetical protein
VANGKSFGLPLIIGILVALVLGGCLYYWAHNDILAILGVLVGIGVGMLIYYW